MPECKHCDGSGWIYYHFEGCYIRESCEWCAEAFDGQEETIDEARQRMNDDEKAEDAAWEKGR